MPWLGWNPDDAPGSDFEGGRKVVLQSEKRWVYSIKPFILGSPTKKKKKIRVWRIIFLQSEKNPSLKNHFSATLKITSKGAD